MSLTPQDVEQQVFRERRRGYDPEEVDRFLDQVAASLAELRRESDRAQERIAELEQASEDTRESETLLRRTLLTAERTAEQTVKNAEEEAERILEQARQAATDMVQNAEADAAEMRRSAEEDAAEVRRAADEESSRDREVARVGAERVRRAVAELQEFREAYRDRVQAVIAEQLAALERVGDLPDLDPDMEKLADLSGEVVDAPAAERE